MKRLLLAACLLALSFPGIPQNALNRCLSDSACRDDQYCLKPFKDEWGQCFGRVLKSATCAKDSDCKEGYQCQRPNTNVEWTCKKRR